MQLYGRPRQGAVADISAEVSGVRGLLRNLAQVKRHIAPAAGMVCDPSIKVPSKNLGITIQSRRGQGWPSRKGSEVGDAGEARASGSIALQKEYIAPR